MPPQQQEFYLPLIKKEHITKDTYSFYFEKPDSLHYLPGQYVRISFPTHNGTISRFFTIASSPLEKYLMITTKIHDGSSEFKKALFNINSDEHVKFFGPIGGFVLHDEDTFHHVFLAGGIGITPFHSMITYVVQKGLTIPITLFVSFSTQDEIIYYDELTKIAKENQFINVINTLTNPDRMWKSEIGRVSEELIKKYVSDIDKPMYYISGPQSMVEASEELLENMEINISRIKEDVFTGY